MSTTPAPATHPSDAAQAPSAPALRVVGVLAVRPVLILLMGIAVISANIAPMSMNAFIVVIDVAALLVVGLALRSEGRRLRDLFAPFRLVDLAWGLLLFVIFTVGFFASNFVANLIVYGGAPPMQTGPVASIPLWIGLVALIVAPLTIAVSEEAVYRGYAQPRLERRLGRIGALVVVAVVFGIQHAGFALTSAPEMAARVLTTLLAGLILGALWLWMRRLVPLVLAHWGLDLIFLGLPTFLLVFA